MEKGRGFHMTQRDEEHYMTAAEAVAYLKISRAALGRHVQKKRLKKYKRDISREVYFKKSELDTLTIFRPVEDDA
jgi:Helix-turn-helix domain